MDNGSGDEEQAAPPFRASIDGDLDGLRLDKALAVSLPAEAGFSRSRLRTLIEAGAVSRTGGATVLDASYKVKTGEAYDLQPPPIMPATPEAEDLPLTVLHEDADLIVVDKPSGMVVHPAPGAWTGTLVNALLHHCGAELSGIGGEARPGIVHRIDKDTSGLLVVAKSDAAHQGLSAQFAAHDLERSYQAVVWGTPDRADPRMMGLPSVSAEGALIRIETLIGRHRADRKKMAVQNSGGRRAVTRFGLIERFGGMAALVECRLETGRTHQIRVHMAHVGHPLMGDPVYGGSRSPAALTEAAAATVKAFPRQALHAATLGFRHPGTGEILRFTAPPPEDFNQLTTALRDGITKR